MALQSTKVAQDGVVSTICHFLQVELYYNFGTSAFVVVPPFHLEGATSWPSSRGLLGNPVLSKDPVKSSLRPPPGRPDTNCQARAKFGDCQASFLFLNGIGGFPKLEVPFRGSP